MIGRVAEVWRYPVKSMQGFRAPSVEVGPSGIEGDRSWALVDVGSGRVISAKRTAGLLNARSSDEAITLPDGTELALDEPGPDVDEALSSWLGRPVTLRAAATSEGLSYDMTFDPPNDDAEYYDIDIKAGTFLDLFPVHLVTTATLAGCARRRPDIDWSVRRFRPNFVLEVEGEPFVENDWQGRRVRVGDVELAVAMPTVRCAMPLRQQPEAADGGEALLRQPELFRALNELNEPFPNHLGAYAEVATSGTVREGDAVELLDG